MISIKRIKFIRSLQHKKNRNIHDSFIVESHKDVTELLRSSYDVEELFATRDWIRDNEIPDTILVHQVTDEELQRISSLKRSSAVLAIVKKPSDMKEFNMKGISIALDNIQDPGNLGTIIRVCDFFGIQNIFCSNDTVDVYNPKVVQSTKGSIFRVNTIYTDIYCLIRNLKEEVDIYATVLDGENIESRNLQNDTIIILGNESHGVSQQILDLVDKRITIYGKGNVNSLNVAVATSIVLSKILS